ncbi:hypothetical protein BDN72DRAFT_934383 [Pluteus cervinus]|uniref:Uncharacterized protein n=1 Tax=Pluteus cervinus TaxID=181527 RepID=A0ACD3A7X7_9AGAR|nr:hypothetical protein BDN72DRAFT_934383 [Pluteus cervinus]
MSHLKPLGGWTVKPLDRLLILLKSSCVHTAKVISKRSWLEALAVIYVFLRVLVSYGLLYHDTGSIHMCSKAMEHINVDVCHDLRDTTDLVVFDCYTLLTRYPLSDVAFVQKIVASDQWNLSMIAIDFFADNTGLYTFLLKWWNTAGVNLAPTSDDITPNMPFYHTSTAFNVGSQELSDRTLFWNRVPLRDSSFIGSLSRLPSSISTLVELDGHTLLTRCPLLFHLHGLAIRDLDKLDTESDETILELFDQTRVLTVESSEVTGQDERDITVAVFIPWTLADGVCLVGEEDLDKRDMPLDEIPHNLSLQSNSADNVQVTVPESVIAISAVTSLAATPIDILPSSPLFLGDSPSVSGEDIRRDSNQTLLIKEQPLDYQPITTTNTTTDSIPAPLGTNSDDELALNITTMATTKKFNFNNIELVAYFTQGEQPRAVAPLDSRTRRKIPLQCIFSLVIAALVQLPTPPQQWVEFIRQHPSSTAAATLPLDQFDIQQWFINIKNTLEQENFFGFGLLSVIVVTVIVVVLEKIWAIYALYCFVVAGILVPGYLGLGLVLGQYRGFRYPFGDFQVPVVDEEDGEEEIQEEVTLVVEEELMKEAQERCTTEAKDSEEASSEVQPKEAQAPISEVQEEVSLESTVRVAQVQVKPKSNLNASSSSSPSWLLKITNTRSHSRTTGIRLMRSWKRLVENATNSGFNNQDAGSSDKKKKPNFNWSTKMAVPKPCNIYMRPVKLIAWVYTAMDIDHPDHGDKPWFDPHFRERANKINVNHTEHGPFSFTSFRVSYHIVEVPEGTVIHRLCEQMLATSVWGNARLSMDFPVKMTSPALLEVLTFSLLNELWFQPIRRRAKRRPRIWKPTSPANSRCIFSSGLRSEPPSYNLLAYWVINFTVFDVSLHDSYPPPGGCRKVQSVDLDELQGSQLITLWKEMRTEVHGGDSVMVGVGNITISASVYRSAYWRTDESLRQSTVIYDAQPSQILSDESYRQISSVGPYLQVQHPNLVTLVAPIGLVLSFYSPSLSWFYSSPSLVASFVAHSTNKHFLYFFPTTYDYNVLSFGFLPFWVTELHFAFVSANNRNAFPKTNVSCPFSVSGGIMRLHFRRRAIKVTSVHRRALELGARTTVTKDQRARYTLELGASVEVPAGKSIVVKVRQTSPQSTAKDDSEISGWSNIVKAEKMV